MSYDTQQPHIASYVIVRKDNKIAMLLRSNTAWMNDYYCLPSGKVEKGEPGIAAAIREAKEEIGITLKSEQLKPVLVCHRHEPSKYADDWLDLVFEAIKWQGEPYNAEPNVHSKLAWFSLDNLPENTIESVRFMLQQIKDGKTYAQFGWQ